jgi:peroxiredoxin
VVFSIGNLRKPKAVEDFVKVQGLSGEDPLFHVFPGAWHVFKLYKGRGAPNTYLIDKKGQVRFIHRAFQPGNEKILKREIQALLAEKG